MLAPSRTLAEAPGLSVSEEPAGSASVVGAFLVVVAAQIVFAPFAQFPIPSAKLPLVLGGAALLWISRPRVAPRLAVAVGAWFAVCALATVFGVDPWVSLLGQEDQASGLMLVAACAVLAITGAGLRRSLADRLPVWLVGTGCAVALVGLVGRLAPWAVSIVLPGLKLDGSTLGHPVFLAAFMAVALAAATEVAVRRPGLAMAATAVFASGLAVAGKRGGWLAAAVALAIALRGRRLDRRTALALCGILVAVTTAWTTVDLLTDPAEPLTAGRRLDELASGSALARPYVMATSARATAMRPILGWGPGNLWGANLTAASEREMGVTGRVWHDAHNLVMESAVTAGVAGALAIVVVLLVLARGAMRAPRRPAWAAGAAAALLVHHLLQPIHVSLTPLMFLLAGVAAGPGLARSARRGSRAPGRTMFVLGVAVLMAGGLLSGLRLASATFELQGRKYASEPALRMALRLEPLRISAAQKLAIERALDSRGADASAGREASAMARRLVRQHPWDGDVRLIAADVEILQDHFDAATAWMREQLQVFPNDPWALAGMAWLAMRTGDDASAEYWTKRALALDPCGPASRFRSGLSDCVTISTKNLRRER